MQHKFDEAVRTRLEALPDGSFNLEGTWNRISQRPRRIIPWGRWLAAVTACIAVWVVIRLSQPVRPALNIVVRKKEMDVPKTSMATTVARPGKAVTTPQPATGTKAHALPEVSPTTDDPTMRSLNWDTVSVSPESLVFLPEIHPAPAKEEQESFGATVTLIIPEQPVKKSFWARFRKQKEVPSLWQKFGAPEAMGKVKTDSSRKP